MTHSSASNQCEITVAAAEIDNNDPSDIPFRGHPLEGPDLHIK